MSKTEASSMERFKEQIRREWTDPTLVAAYRKWDAQEAAVGRAATKVIVERARVEPGLKVLDLASGHGEPSLALAEAVGPEGHVTATDLSPGLLGILRERAHRAGLTNITCRQADAHELPFTDGAFDRVTCKWGVMYFADYPQALKEAHRVLKPGGRATFVAWGPPQQPFFASLVGPIFSRVELPPPEPGEPNPFVFSESGTLSAALREAGFKEVEEETVTIPVVFPGTPEEQWQWLLEMTPPFIPIIQGMALEQREEAIGEVITALEENFDGERVTLQAEIVAAAGMH
jgi:ubiquinone/menaquinone biosynthesis C-methylase UbiE